jgi:hypothetical protein
LNGSARGVAHELIADESLVESTALSRACSSVIASSQRGSKAAFDTGRQRHHIRCRETVQDETRDDGVAGRWWGFRHACVDAFKRHAFSVHGAQAAGRARQHRATDIDTSHMRLWA